MKVYFAHRLKWAPSTVAGLTMGEVQRIIDGDPHTRSGGEQVVVIGRPMTFEERWERNGARPWA